MFTSFCAEVWRAGSIAILVRILTRDFDLRSVSRDVVDWFSLVFAVSLFRKRDLLSKVLR